MKVHCLVIDAYPADRESLEKYDEKIVWHLADTLDWYSLEPRGIGDYEMENGENLNAWCDGFYDPEDGREFTFANGLRVAPLADALQDIESMEVGIGAVISSSGGIGWCETSDFDDVEMYAEDAAAEIEACYGPEGKEPVAAIVWAHQ